METIASSLGHLLTSSSFAPPMNTQQSVPEIRRERRALQFIHCMNKFKEIRSSLVRKNVRMKLNLTNIQRAIVLLQDKVTILIDRVDRETREELSE